MQNRFNLSVTLRDLDRYMWLAGQYRAWLKKRDDAQTNSELQSMFMDNAPEIQRLLNILWPEE